MKKLQRFTSFCFMFSILLTTGRVIAATEVQTLTLQPGWNAVFLEVEPTDTNPAVVFSGITDLVSVWAWNPQANTIQYIQNPDALIPEQQEMLAYMPGNAMLTNLYGIHGGTGYLVQLGGTVDVNWTVTGEPVIPDIDWKANSFNLVGFHLAGGFGAAGPMFTDFFSSSPAHAGEEVYVLDNATGAWILADASVQMRQGEAFWIYCHGSSEFNGPVSIQLNQSTGLRYGSVLDDQEVIVKNDSENAKSVILTPTSADVPLFYYQFDPDGKVGRWIALTQGAPLTLPLQAGGHQWLRLGVKRAGLTNVEPYTTNIEVADGEGIRFLLPVSVSSVSTAGLWVGVVTINKVNQPADGNNRDVPVSVGSPFTFPIIIHNDASSQVRLLQSVIQMWQEGAWIPDPDNQGHLIVDPNNSGHFVLLADDTLVENYSGAALRDGQQVARRISSSAFAFDAPQLLAGSFTQGGTLSVTLPPPADAVNPFRHQYNPDHLNADDYQIIRTVTLKFNDPDADDNPISGASTLDWGSTEVGGIYTETLQGLHRDDLHTEGTFLLHRVSDVDVLTMN